MVCGLRRDAAVNGFPGIKMRMHIAPDPNRTVFSFADALPSDAPCPPNTFRDCP